MKKATGKTPAKGAPAAKAKKEAPPPKIDQKAIEEAARLAKIEAKIRLFRDPAVKSSKILASIDMKELDFKLDIDYKNR